METLDQLVKLRKTTRTSFTRLVNSLKEDLHEDTVDKTKIQISFTLLQKKNEQLLEFDSKIINLKLNDTDEELEEESNVADMYQRAFLEVQVSVNQSGLDSISNLSINENAVSVIDTNAKRKFKLPKLELRKFSGDVKEWLHFWSQFEKIDNDPDITPEDKFQYLIQATIKGSRAREVIDSFPPTGQNYKKAVDSLKARFGREELLVEVYVRELLRLVMKNVSVVDRTSLCTLYDNLETQMRALETLGVTTDKCAAMLYPLVESCLPEELLRAWQRNNNFSQRNDSKDKLDNLMTFLRSEVEAEERIQLAIAGFGLERQIKGKNKPIKVFEQEPTAAGLLSTSVVDNKGKCIFCEGSHETPKCFRAKKMTLADKHQLLKDNGCCYRCLKKGHMANKCRVAVKCVSCGKGHDILMCSELRKNEMTPQTNLTKDKKNEEQSSVSMSNVSKLHTVFLQTLRVNLMGPLSSLPVRALIDTGSQKSYILEKTAIRLGYLPTRQVVITHSLFGGIKTEPKKHSCYKVELSSLDKHFLCNFETVGHSAICGDIPSIPTGPWIDELKQKRIYINDTERHPGPIELLLGADVAGKLLTGRRRELNCGPVAVETKLGWTLMGKVPSLKVDESLAMAITTMFVNEASITDLWELDIIGITDPVSKATKMEIEIMVKDKFRQSVVINEEGRYEVALPWTEEHLPIPSYRNLALKRLDTMTRRLQSNGLFNMYDEVLLEWEKMGIIEEVPDNIIERGCYLPHRPVLKETSSTRMRPVFDASVRNKTFPSLNQCLESGPNLIELIPSLFLRFRELKYGVIADIEKAFLQISVRDSDRDFLRFFWWKTGDKNENKLKTLRHTRVVFGARCSPFLLGAVLELHLQKAKENPLYNKELIDRLAQSFYVDNVVTSLRSEQELTQFVTEARQVMAEGKFNLRSWQYTTGPYQPQVRSPVLGMFWDLPDDTLKINLDWTDTFELGPITKRTILSVAQKIFDPVGIVCPVTLFPKILLQKIWKNGISWDDEVDVDTKGDFRRWYEELHLLKNINVGRWLHIYPDTMENVSIHTFCDASIRGYAAIVVLRVQNFEECRTYLVAAKSRVSPIKQVSIPRLELIATAVGARLYRSVIEGFQWEKIESHFWTDSTTVLAWLRREELWSVFVNNRVKEIKDLTEINSWKHVPGFKNPADLPSRGCLPRQLLATKWWEGPQWLKNIPEEWPSQKFTYDEDIVSQERRKSKTIYTQHVMEGSPEQKHKCEWCDVTATEINTNCKYHGLRWYYRYFSNFDKMVRMIAWIQRFLYNCQAPKHLKKTGELIFEETNKAEKKVMHFIQEESHIQNDKKLKSLNVYKDNEGLIRLKTKIIYRKDAEDFRRPVVLPSEHIVVRRLILTEHLRCSHASSQILLNILREHYWILNARRTIKSVLSKCIVCIRHEGKGMNAPTAPLPESRTRDATAFEVVGVDLSGPLFLREGNKAWVCLFTCAVYRAVHLELLSSVSTEVFLQGFRRFIARRGRPFLIYCDNGTNFIGASNALEAVDWNQVMQFSTVRKIEWRFNPPTAAWWGGFWERLVRTMKQFLRKVLGRAHLSYEEMITILCDTEAIINSRPLTYVSDCQGDLTPLSPALFIQDVPTSGVPDLDTLDEKALNKRLAYRMKLRADLRNRFRSEYLGLLVQRPDSKEVYKKIAVGDVVLIGSDNVKRMDWPLGRVIEILPGKENITRLVRIQTAHSELLRPIQRIFPLEINTAEMSDLRNPLQKKKSSYDCKAEVFTRSGRLVKIPERLGL